MHVVFTTDLSEEALRLAVTLGITACDAAYVVLSQRLAIPLVTADETLVKQLKGSQVDLRSLGD
jgi:predicted nucleic acid-binding protein